MRLAQAKMGTPSAADVFASRCENESPTRGGLYRPSLRGAIAVLRRILPEPPPVVARTPDVGRPRLNGQTFGHGPWRGRETPQRGRGRETPPQRGNRGRENASVKRR